MIKRGLLSIYDQLIILLYILSKFFYIFIIIYFIKGFFRLIRVYFHLIYFQIEISAQFERFILRVI